MSYCKVCHLSCISNPSTRLSSRAKRNELTLSILARTIHSAMSICTSTIHEYLLSMHLDYSVEYLISPSLKLSLKLFDATHGVWPILISALSLFLSTFFFIIYTSSLPQRSMLRSSKIQENAYCRYLISLL